MLFVFMSKMFLHICLCGGCCLFVSMLTVVVVFVVVCLGLGGERLSDEFSNFAQL